MSSESPRIKRSLLRSRRWWLYFTGALAFLRRVVAGATLAIWFCEGARFLVRNIYLEINVYGRFQGLLGWISYFVTAVAFRGEFYRRKNELIRLVFCPVVKCQKFSSKYSSTRVRVYVILCEYTSPENVERGHSCIQH